MKEETIKLSVGDVVLIEPSAFIRNNALIKAETEAAKVGSSEPIKSVFITELLPKCVKAHPFTHTKTIAESLGELSCSDYDKLSAGVSNLMKVLTPEDKKK